MATADELWMDMALDLARKAEGSGNTPVASIIVQDGIKIGEGSNRAVTDRNPVLHAEMVAIQEACQLHQRGDLGGATLYSTMEPCPMCAWAICCAKIRRVVLGARHADIKRTDLGRYSFERLMEMMGQQIELVTGVHNAECVRLRLDWTAKTGRWS